MKEFTMEAMKRLQDIYGDEICALTLSIDTIATQIADVQVRREVIRRKKLQLLEPTGYIQSLIEEDRAKARIKIFEEVTGVSLT